jgi:hypothetical protein
MPLKFAGNPDKKYPPRMNMLWISTTDKLVGHKHSSDRFFFNIYQTKIFFMAMNLLSYQIENTCCAIQAGNKS